MGGEMFDIHCHLLYDVDDGPSTVQESLGMLEEARKAGVSTIFATPHLRNGVMNSIQNIDKGFELLRNKALEYNIVVRKGYEIAIRPDIAALQMPLKDLSLDGSGYMLFEFPINDLPFYGEDFVYQLELDGIIPIIAHPERNGSFVKNIGLLKGYIDMGCMIQVDAGSIVGAFGRRTLKCAKALLKEGIADFVASDAHCASDYKKAYVNAYKKAVRWVGQEKAYMLFHGNAERIWGTVGRAQP
jgi:protein-tyrosine phosphatase